MEVEVATGTLAMSVLAEVYILVLQCEAEAKLVFCLKRILMVDVAHLFSFFIATNNDVLKV